jgi:hypothetical protein
MPWLIVVLLVVCLMQTATQTSLHEAADKGQELVVRALVDAGADVNAKDYWVQSKCAVVGCVLMGVVAEAAWWRWLHVQMQKTPLHEAARNGHEAVTRALLTAGADVNAKGYMVHSKCAVVGCVLTEVV